MAQSTARDCDKTIKDLSLRQKIVHKGTMNGFKDSKLWKRVIDKQVNNLAHSIERCTQIIKELTRLREACKKASDTLEAEVEVLMNKLKSRVASLETKLKDLEQKMKNIGCVNNGKELLRAIFTLGLACLMPNDTKKKL